MKPPSRKSSKRSLLAQILLYPTIWYVKYLQYRYKYLTNKWKFKQSNSHLNRLIFLQSLIYFFKVEFKCWGFFHPSCVCSDKQTKFVKNLFPFIEFNLPSVLIQHPDAVTFYHNKLYDFGYKKDVKLIAVDIKKQLIEWEKPRKSYPVNPNLKKQSKRKK